jgi:hypothetical protein
MVLAALAATAGNALVQALVTDGWEGVRRRVAQLFGRGKPDPQIERRLDATRLQLTEAPPGELAGAKQAQAAQWRVRFADLLADHPDAEAELRTLVEQLAAAQPGGGNVTNTISGGTQGTVLMGRDFSGVTLSPKPADEPGT